jgi:hypothetical protein
LKERICFFYSSQINFEGGFVQWEKIDDDPFGSSDCGWPCTATGDIYYGKEKTWPESVIEGRDQLFYRSQNFEGVQWGRSEVFHNVIIIINKLLNDDPWQ